MGSSIKEPVIFAKSLLHEIVSRGYLIVDHEAGGIVFRQLRTEIQLDVTGVDVPSEVFADLDAIQPDRVVEFIERNIHFVPHLPVQFISCFSDLINVGFEISSGQYIVAKRISTISDNDLAVFDRLICNTVLGDRVADAALLFIADRFDDLLLILLQVYAVASAAFLRMLTELAPIKQATEAQPTAAAGM